MCEFTMRYKWHNSIQFNTWTSLLNTSSCGGMTGAATGNTGATGATTGMTGAARVVTGVGTGGSALASGGDLIWLWATSSLSKNKHIFDLFSWGSQ